MLKVVCGISFLGVSMLYFVLLWKSGRDHLICFGLVSARDARMLLLLFAGMQTIQQHLKMMLQDGTHLIMVPWRQQTVLLSLTKMWVRMEMSPGRSATCMVVKNRVHKAPQLPEHKCYDKKRKISPEASSSVRYF